MNDSLPPDLTVEALALSPAELRAYPRWYTDLLLRKRAETVAIGDTFKFIDNFGVSDADKDSITQLFGIKLVTLEPPQFYVFLRLTGHILEGKTLRKELAFVSAPVPKPRSILSKGVKRSGGPESRDDDSTASLPSANPFRKSASPSAPSTSGGDGMDSFLSLMKGKAQSTPPISRTKKRVTFDPRPPQVSEAAQRSMQELMRQRGRELPQVYQPIPPPPQQPSQSLEPQSTPEEEEPVPTNHFANVHIDSVLYHGTSTLPVPPPPRKPLTPNVTGPTEMVQLGVLSPGASMSSIMEQPFQFNQPQQQTQQIPQFNAPSQPPAVPSPRGASPAVQLQSQNTGGRSPSPMDFPVGYGQMPQQQQPQQPQQHNYLHPQSSGYTQPMQQPFQSSLQPPQMPSQLQSQPQMPSQLNPQLTSQSIQPIQQQYSGLSLHSQHSLHPQHSGLAAPPTHSPTLAQFSQQFSQSATPSPVRLSPMPTGAEFLSSVSGTGSIQNRAPAPPPRPSGLQQSYTQQWQ